MSIIPQTMAYSITGAAEAVSMPANTIRAAIHTGALMAHYPTSKPLILAEDLRAWVAAAPTGSSLAEAGR